MICWVLDAIAKPLQTTSISSHLNTCITRVVVSLDVSSAHFILSHLKFPNSSTLQFNQVYWLHTIISSNIIRWPQFVVATSNEYIAQFQPRSSFCSHRKTLMYWMNKSRLLGILVFISDNNAAQEECSRRKSAFDLISLQINYYVNWIDHFFFTLAFHIYLVRRALHSFSKHFKNETLSAKKVFSIEIRYSNNMLIPLKSLFSPVIVWTFSMQL